MLAVRFASGLGHFQLVPARRVESQYAMPLCLEGSLRRTAISVWLVGLNRGTLITCGVWAGSCQVAEQDPGHYSTTRPPPSRCVRQVPPLRSVNGEGSACSSPPTPFGETRDPVDSFGFSCFELTVRSWISHILGLALRHGRSARLPHTCGIGTCRRGRVSVVPARGKFPAGISSLPLHPASARWLWHCA